MQQHQEQEWSCSYGPTTKSNFYPRVTLDYKSTKLQENVDWELCHSKYSDIMDAFQVQYPMEPTEKDFPYDASMVSKAQVSAKLKKKKHT